MRPVQWLIQHARLEHLWLTVVFWTSVLLQSLAFGLCPYPPMIDYPQHVAMGAVYHRMLDRSAPEWSLYETNFFTYNAGIETAIGYLSYLMRPEAVGRMLFFFYPIAFAAAALRFCDIAKRPRWYALLALPLVYNFVCGWGFANFILGLPIAMLAVGAWIRLVDGRRGAWPIASVAILMMVVAYTHVLVMLCVCICVAVVGLIRLFEREPDDMLERFKTLLVPGAVMVPAVGYSYGAWKWARLTSHTFWEHSWAEGQDEPAWQKLRYLVYNTTGNFSDSWDQYLFIAAAVIAIAIWIHSLRGEFDPRMKRLAIAFALAYLIVPKVFIGTFHIYIRFLPIAVLFGLASLPVLKERAQWLIVAASAVALATGANLLWRFQTIPEMDDAMAIIDDIPENHKLIGVTYDAAPKGLFREIWVHLPSVYQARKRGILAYSFARNESPPIRYRADTEPPRPPGGFEWDGRVYDPHAAYARYYDMVLVRSWLGPDGSQVDPAAYVFKDLAPFVKQLSKRGRFYLYDASALSRGGYPTQLPDP